MIDKIEVCKTCNGTGIEYDGAGHTCTACNGIATPVAERQPPHQIHDCCVNCMQGNDAHTDDGRCPAPYTTVWRAWDYNFAPDTDPPELAELQATIERLTAENERLLSGFWQQVTDADLKKIADFVGDGDLPTNSFFMRKDAGDLANMTMHMVREVQSLRAEIERLKGGQGEPVAYADPESFENFKNLAHLGGLYAHEWMWANPAPGLKPLYTSQPAPVSVVLKDHEFRETVNRLRDTALQYRDAEQLRERISVELRACLDKVKELNQ